MSPENLSYLSYSIGNEQGKMRSDKLGNLREYSRWKLPVLTTGEVSIEAKVQENGKGFCRAGQQVRIVSISDAICGEMGVFDNIHEFKSPQAFSEYLQSASKIFFGSPIQRMIEVYIGNMEDYDSILNNWYIDFCRNVCPTECSPQLRRIVNKFAYAAGVGELAILFGVLPLKSNMVFDGIKDLCIRFIKHRGIYDYEEKHTFESIHEFIELNNGKFIHINDRSQYMLMSIQKIS